MTDKDSINLEQLYAHAHVQRQISAEWNDMSERIIENHGDQLVADGVMEEGMWDSIKSGAGKVAGAVGDAWGATKTAVKDKLMMPVVKMLQQKFPDAFAQLAAWVQQNPNAKDFSAIADKSVSESIYQHCKSPITEDVSHQYPLDDLWAEANRVEYNAKLEEAWNIFERTSAPQHALRQRTAALKKAGHADAPHEGMFFPAAEKGGLPAYKAALDKFEASAGGGASAGGTEAPAPEAPAAATPDAPGAPIGGDINSLKKAAADFKSANAGADTAELDRAIANLEGGAGPAAPATSDAPGSTSTVNNPDPSTDGGTPAGGAEPAVAPAGGAEPALAGPGGVSSTGDDAEAETGSGESGSMLSKVWNWMKSNPGKAATVGGLAALLLFVGLTPVTFLGLIRGLGTGIAQGAAMADPDVAGQDVVTTMAGGDF